MGAGDGDRALGPCARLRHRGRGDPQFRRQRHHRPQHVPSSRRATGGSPGRPRTRCFATRGTRGSRRAAPSAEFSTAGDRHCRRAARVKGRGTQGPDTGHGRVGAVCHRRHAPADPAGWARCLGARADRGGARGRCGAVPERGDWAAGAAPDQGAAGDGDAARHSADDRVRPHDYDDGDPPLFDSDGLAEGP